MTKLSRRQMFSGIAGMVGAGYLTTNAARVKGSEYMFAPGLIYLNTGLLGPMPRSILDAVRKAWHELETNPVGMSYGAGTVHTLADGVRFQVAGVYAGVGDKDKPFEWLEKDFQSHNGDFDFIRWQIPQEALRDDPRFKDLLKRMGLPE